MSQFSLIQAPSSQTDCCSQHLFSEIFVLLIFTLRAVLEEQIKLLNWGITEMLKKNRIVNAEQKSVDNHFSESAEP
jgi:hypothetical protein